MTKHVLVKHHRFDGEEIYTEELVYCRAHLDETLRESPLRDDESVQDADADLQCERCWPGSLQAGD